MSFANIQAVDDWAEKNGGEDALRSAFARGNWADRRSLQLIQAWLDNCDALRRSQQENSAESLARRSTEAAETSAAASVRSVRYAALALFISLLSLVISLIT